MGRRLIDSLSTVTMAVIDFEYTTPTGAPKEPFEVAVQVLHVEHGKINLGAEFEALMRPPAHAALTVFDTGQTGITPEMVAEQPPATEVLARLDRRFTAGPYVLIAHHAPAEAGVLSAYRQSCPNLARLPILDTVRLARDLYPDLPKHSLDQIVRHLGIPAPPDRHRAGADVRLTAEIFIRMVTDSTTWMNLDHLRAIAGYTPQAPPPEQTTLFD
ncbi:exonuclease domain-containing protein [Nocardia sp.]|uniref:3'-5' exonuclease n=1 Tax=Nocardia sp. TaxID=1821 RepID=UPI00258EE9C1|nr:exonuclease domain-containing protein [Nocardia sp.]